MVLQMENVCQKKLYAGIYWHNNFVGDVTVEVAYAINVFQLSGIYRQIEFDCNSIRNN